MFQSNVLPPLLFDLEEFSVTFFTGWVTDNSCQVNNDVVLFDKCLVSWGVQDITLDNSQVWMMKNSEKWLSSPSENIINSYFFILHFRSRFRDEAEVNPRWSQGWEPSGLNPVYPWTGHRMDRVGWSVTIPLYPSWRKSGTIVDPK